MIPTKSDSQESKESESFDFPTASTETSYSLSSGDSVKGRSFSWDIDGKLVPDLNGRVFGVVVKKKVFPMKTLDDFNSLMDTIDSLKQKRILKIVIELNTQDYLYLTHSEVIKYLVRV